MQYGELKLVRLKETESQILGCLTALGLPALVTLELPWRNNERNASCIPEGHYVCTLDKHRLLGDVIRLLDVPGRDGILIHVGNYPKDTNGCVLVGTTISRMQSSEKETLITHSKDAMQSLLAYVKIYCKQGFFITIGSAKWPDLPEKID